jgi:hypothetical protein
MVLSKGTHPKSYMMHMFPLKGPREQYVALHFMLNELLLRTDEHRSVSPYCNGDA